jgi:hypothetical protein
MECAVLKNGEVVVDGDLRYKIKWVEKALQGVSQTDETITVIVPGWKEEEHVFIPSGIYEFMKDWPEPEKAAHRDPQEFKLKRGEFFVDYLGRNWYRDLDGRVYIIIKSQILESAKYEDGKVEWKDLPLKEVETDDHKNLVNLAKCLYTMAHRVECPEPDYLP